GDDSARAEPAADPALPAAQPGRRRPRRAAPAARQDGGPLLGPAPVQPPRRRRRPDRRLPRRIALAAPRRDAALPARRLRIAYDDPHPARRSHRAVTLVPWHAARQLRWNRALRPPSARDDL